MANRIPAESAIRAEDSRLCMSRILILTHCSFIGDGILSFLPICDIVDFVIENSSSDRWLALIRMQNRCSNVPLRKLSTSIQMVLSYCQKSPKWTCFWFCLRIHWISTIDPVRRHCSYSVTVPDHPWGSCPILAGKQINTVTWTFQLKNEIGNWIWH